MGRKSTAEPDEKEIGAAFEAALARAGHAMPRGLREGLLANHKDMVRQAAIVRSVELGAEAEPANTFSLEAYRPRNDRDV